ncbi:MAG: Hpt domain-containing protein [Puniceicoccales bacterium]
MTLDPYNDQAERPVLDLGYLEYWREFAGNELPTFLQGLIADFRQDFALQREELQQICAERDVEKLIAQIHRLAGSVGNLGMSRAAALCRQAERDARQDTFDGFDTIVAEIDRQVDVGLDALREYCR